MSDEIRSYIELHQQIREALRVQNPEWVDTSGECPACDSYEHRLAELLALFTPEEESTVA